MATTALREGGRRRALPFVPANRLLRQSYGRLTPWQKVLVARHPDRPHSLAYITALITDFVPLQHSTKGLRVTQFDSGAIEKLGLVKIDLLGIIQLAVPEAFCDAENYAATKAHELTRWTAHATRLNRDLQDPRCRRPARSGDSAF